MNTKDFIQTLRKVIREEVQIAVRTELKEFSSVISESRKPTQIKNNSYTNTFKAKSDVKQYTKNPILNSILNETTAHSTMHDTIDYNDQSEWPTMSNNMSHSMPTALTDVEGNRYQTNDLETTPAGSAVLNALNRDYSSLMKRIEQKKGE
jgi:hypothetical protein